MRALHILLYFLYTIIKGMAVNTRGRPICRAVIDFASDPDEEFYEQFYEACQQLSCSDMRKLARALRVDLTTIYRWKLRTYFPERKGIAALVIRWVQQGKPVEFVSPDIYSS